MAASPAGEHHLCYAVRRHLANTIVFAGSVVHRSHGEKHERTWTWCSFAKRQQRMPPLPC
jgi:hypothetical protein